MTSRPFTPSTKIRAFTPRFKPGDIIPLEVLKRQRQTAAKLVAMHHEKYLWVFERIDAEYKKRLAKEDILNQALSLANEDDQ